MTNTWKHRNTGQFAILGILCVVLTFMTGGVYAQSSSGAAAAPMPSISASPLPGAPSGAQGATPPAPAPGVQAPSASSMTPQQADAYQKLSPAQKGALASELGKTGGQVTPEAVEALKGRPEFKDLSPEDIAKGRQMLEQREKGDTGKKGDESKADALKKVQEKRTPFDLEKTVIGEEAAGDTLFDRSRTIRPYQDVSLRLRPFGYDFFQEAAVRVSTDRKDVPVPLKYVIGPGDEVRLLLWGRVNAQYNLTVDRDGKITIPQIGPLFVAGMTFEDMSSQVIKQAEQIVGTNVDISMGSLKTIPIFVLGDVRRPGAYTIGSFATMTDALLMAGGPTLIGSMRRIQLKRKDRIVSTFDLYDLLLKGDKSKDVTLMAGDVVFVPVSGTLTGIAGNIKRPAIYELKERHDLEKLIELAGGIIPTAYTQQIQVERIVKNERHVILDINDKNLEKAREIKLQDADLVKIFSIVDRDVNAVYLYGNVKRPGKYEMKEGMTLRDILPGIQDLLPETHFDYALIKRLNPPQLEPVLIPFNLGQVLLTTPDATSLRLQPQDQVYIFSKWFFQDKPVFSVEGEVRHPGRFSLTDNFKIKDAILAAGDLTKEAYLKKGQIIRVNKKREHQTIYFNVAKVMAGDATENILLKDEDRIIIHALWDEKWRETVSIAGEVKRPGSMTLTEAMRVSDLFFKAGGQTRDTYMGEAEIYRTDWNTKAVTLMKLNLGKALKGDEAHNIPLQDLDRLIVHSTWQWVYKKEVTIQGDVLKPGIYQYADNMTVKDLVFTAGNILESAYIDEAELSSIVIDERKIAKTRHRAIDLRKALAGDPEHNLVLSPRDTLFVKQIPDWGAFDYVTLSGEFKFPGRYVIRKGEKLSSVIERAGGYLPTAYLRASYFTRESVRRLQQKSLSDMASRMERELMSETSARAGSSVTAEEIQAKTVEAQMKQRLIEYMKNLKATGRMTIALTHLRMLKGSMYDIELEEGDTLHLPKLNSVVNVVGAVMSEGSHIYNDKWDYRDYIAMAGGQARYADDSNIFVVKVDGSARKLSSGFMEWSDKRARWELAAFGQEIRQIEPGDVIVVPEKIASIAWLREIRDITQILMNTAVTAATIIKLW